MGLQGSEPFRKQVLKEALEILNSRAALLAPSGQATLVELDLDRAASRFRSPIPKERLMKTQHEENLFEMKSEENHAPALKPDTIPLRASIAAIYEIS